MTPDLVALMQRVIDAEAEVLRWATENIAGLSAEERVAIDIRYEKARHELCTAQAAYDTALEEATR